LNNRFFVDFTQNRVYLNQDVRSHSSRAKSIIQSSQFIYNSSKLNSV